MVHSHILKTRMFQVHDVDVHLKASFEIWKLQLVLPSEVAMCAVAAIAAKASDMPACQHASKVS